MVAVANAARLSPQHQQAVQAQVRAMAAAQQAQVQAQTQGQQGLMQGQPQPQPVQAMNGSHLSPSLSYTNRSSSSPSVSQASPPPRAPSASGTPVPSVNRSSTTPQPPSTQPLLGAHPAHAQLPSGIVRAPPTGLPNVPHYYGNVNIGGQQFTTTEQMEQALRLQSLIQVRFHSLFFLSISSFFKLTLRTGTPASATSTNVGYSRQRSASPPDYDVAAPVFANFAVTRRLYSVVSCLFICRKRKEILYKNYTIFALIFFSLASCII
jgi:hypothetical protein